MNCPLYFISTSIHSLGSGSSSSELSATRRSERFYNRIYIPRDLGENFPFNVIKEEHTEIVGEMIQSFARMIDVIKRILLFT